MEVYPKPKNYDLKGDKVGHVLHFDGRKPRLREVGIAAPHSNSQADGGSSQKELRASGRSTQRNKQRQDMDLVRANRSGTTAPVLHRQQQRLLQNPQGCPGGAAVQKQVHKCSRKEPLESEKVAKKVRRRMSKRPASSRDRRRPQKDTGTAAGLTLERFTSGRDRRRTKQSAQGGMAA